MNLKHAFFITLFSFLFLASTHVYAAAGDEYNERWTCLAVTRTYEDKNIPAVDQKEWAKFVRWVHSAELSTKPTTLDKPLANSNTYIVECLQIPTNLNIPAAVRAELTANGGKIPTEVCTTGDSNVDKFIWNNDRFATVIKLFSAYGQNGIGYEYQGYYKEDLVSKYEPESTNHYVTTNASGDFPMGKFVYASDTWTGTFVVDRKFMAYNRFAKGDGLNVAGAGGQQQGKLEFTFEGANKNCVKIAWDPYGTVFDTQTLEPVPGTAVALYTNQGGVFRLVNDQDVPGGFIQNPMTTKEDGYFSFIVPDGTYKLAVSATGYTFPTTQTTLQSNAHVIYSDFYHGENIVQQGAMVHRDIPVDAPSSNVTQKYAAKLIGLFQSVTPDGNTIIDGRVSHPYARINAYCKKTDGTKGSLNTTLQADKHGQFKLIFNPSKCNENTGEMYAIVEVEAIDLTRSLTVQNLYDKIIAWILNKKDVQAALVPISYSFDPILNYVEGYAKDSTDTSLPGATVGVYTIGDKNPYRTVKADSTGRFAFNSDQLPKSPYELKYQNTLGASTRVSTTKFIVQNLPTIQKEKIDLYSEKLSPVPTPAPNISQRGTTSESSSNNSSSNIIRSSSDKSSLPTSKTISSTDMQNNAVKNQIIIMIIIMVLIVGVGGMIALFMLKKQNTPTSF